MMMILFCASSIAPCRRSSLLENVFSLLISLILQQRAGSPLHSEDMSVLLAHKDISEQIAEQIWQQKGDDKSDGIYFTRPKQTCRNNKSAGLG